MDSFAGVAFFLLFFSFKTFKTIENSNRQIRRLCADAANEFIRLIGLINSYVAFSFFHFFYDNVFAIRCMSTREITVYITCRTVSIFLVLCFTCFTSFSGHRPAQREWARTGLGSHARCHPYPIPQPVKVDHTTGLSTRKGWPYHRALRPLLFSNSGVGSFTSHKNKSLKVLWDGIYGFSSLSEKTRKSFADVITKAALSSQLFKDPECWSGRGLNLRPPARRTGSLPTELTRRRLNGGGFLNEDMIVPVVITIWANSN